MNTSPSLPSYALKVLAGYPPALLAQVGRLIEQGSLGQVLQQKYPEPHEVRTDKALYDYTLGLKQRYMRSSPPLALVQYDSKLKLLTQALGTHTTVARVQGGKLKAKREIRVASLFRDAPADFLRMIVVHELAHLKEREHDKAFYSLCEHMAPDYHQLEFDLRLYLVQQEGLAMQRKQAAAGGAVDPGKV
jgi:predicted metal-dependent hydrolase